MSVHWAAVGRTRWDLQGKCHFWGREGKGDAGSTLRPPNLLLARDGKGHLHHHLWK